MKTAAWSVPVIAVAASTPAAAATGEVCVGPVVFLTTFTTAVESVNPALLSATGMGSPTTLTVKIETVLSAGTTTTQSGITHNMARDGSGWNGTGDNSGGEDFQFTGFGPAGALVLNQRRDGTDEPAGAGSDSQVLTFTFYDANNVQVNPTGLTMTIFDISSFPGQYSDSWRDRYWDSVGFSIAPTTIAVTPGAINQIGAGVGSTADPYRRSGGNESTPQSGGISDDFAFASFPSGTTLTYTQYDGRQGWHFVSLSALRFTATGIVPCP